MRLIFPGVGIAIFVVWSFGVEADEHCALPVAQIVSLQGRVEVRPVDERHWRLVGLRERFCAGDKIRIEAYSRALVQLQDNTLLHLDGGTLVTFSGIEPNKPSWFELLKGAIHLISRFPHRLEVKTPFVNAAVEGTEFAIRVEPEKALLWVFEGRVLFHNPAGRLTVTSGEAAVAEAGQAPRRRLVIQPRAAVQWALYYPPLIDLRPNVYPSGPEAQGIHAALRAYRDGDLLTALGRLEQVPAAVREASYFTLQAALLLVVGRVEEARPNIQRALQLDPDHGTAYALQSIIALAQNRKEDALRLARQGAKLDPQSPLPQIALSYVYQGRFNIEQALQHAQQATELFPREALAWARVAELQLSLGNSEKAAEAAQQAVALDPDLARTQTVRGFAELTAIDIEEAKAGFQRAIELDPADPMARLGLGLAKIRQGDLKAGTEEIEIAASLDPNNSLIRSYLGKAYYDQKRGEAAATELAIAKELDPNDPTPWFYDAIRKQSANRPVEALHDLQKSIELNDNRAVYRSRLLLDEDLAGRAVSLARIYQDLGFDQLGINESSKTLAIDASNYSAHRFLSDIYAQRPRHEVARVSELLQAQLLQPININVVQPQSLETDLNILFGTSPSEAGFNEFTPLFERDGIQFIGTGTLGNNKTYADQAVLAGVFKKFSYSLGQFYYETDGFRKNNELRHNLYNAFAQVSVTEKLDLQFEYRHRETDEGDLRLNFNPDSFSKILDREIIQTTPRFGMKYSINSQSTFIASFQYTDREEKLIDEAPPSTVSPWELPALDKPMPRDTFKEINDKRNGYDIQAQYLFKTKDINFLSGIGAYHFNGNREERALLAENVANQLIDPGRRLRLRSDEDRSGRWVDGYLYSTLNIPTNVFWTLGLSAVSFEDGQNQLVNFDRLLPKFGFQWQVWNPISLRAAYIKTVKRSRIFEQTLEPTQIARFNQQFDDFNGTIAELYGVGVDVNYSKSISAGIELFRRNLDVPRIFERPDFISHPDISREATISSIFKFEQQKEDQYRAYFYWTPQQNLAFLAEYRLEQFRRTPAKHQFEGRHSETAQSTIPTDIWTTTVPLSIKYFNEIGFFASVGTTYVHQKVSYASESEIKDKENQENFLLADMSIGYRLPKRRGIIGLKIKNLFDKKFNYSDLNIQTPDPSQPLFIPDRIILGQVLLTF